MSQNFETKHKKMSTFQKSTVKRHPSTSAPHQIQKKNTPGFLKPVISAGNKSSEVILSSRTSLAPLSTNIIIHKNNINKIQKQQQHGHPLKTNTISNLTTPSISTSTSTHSFQSFKTPGRHNTNHNNTITTKDSKGLKKFQFYHSPITGSADTNNTANTTNDNTTDEAPIDYKMSLAKPPLEDPVSFTVYDDGQLITKIEINLLKGSNSKDNTNTTTILIGPPKFKEQRLLLLGQRIQEEQLIREDEEEGRGHKVRYMPWYEIPPSRAILDGLSRENVLELVIIDF